MISTEDYILPTIYNGVKYRSRTEARWAKFFDSAGIKFSYECEAIMLQTGPYLPDFEIYVTRGGRKVYAEVKGVFSSEEINRCKALCETTGRQVVMLDGPPDFKTYTVFTWEERLHCESEKCGPFRCESDPCMGVRKYDVNETTAILCTSHCKYYPFYYCPGFEDKDGYFKPEDWYDSHKISIHEAQNERFGIFNKQ